MKLVDVRDIIFDSEKDFEHLTVYLWRSVFGPLYFFPWFMVTCLKDNMYSFSYFDNRNWPVFYLEYYGLNKVKIKEKGTQNSILELSWQKVGFQDKTSFYGILLMIINIKNLSKVTFDCINSDLRHIVTKETMKILIIFALASTISGRFLPKRAFNPWN